MDIRVSVRQRGEDWIVEVRRRPNYLGDPFALMARCAPSEAAAAAWAAVLVRRMLTGRPPVRQLQPPHKGLSEAAVQAIRAGVERRKARRDSQL